MEFPQKVKKQVRLDSNFKCCMCHQNPVMHIHHIDPEKGDVYDNAAPLCANCHYIYGNDPSKRPIIIQQRDFWYEHVEKTRKSKEEEMKKLDDIQEKVDKVDTKTDRLPLIEPIITDMYEKVNVLYGYYKDKDYDGVIKSVSVVSEATSTVSSGMAIINTDLVDSYLRKPKRSKPDNCPYCHKSLVGVGIIDNKCPFCNYPFSIPL